MSEKQGKGWVAMLEALSRISNFKHISEDLAIGGQPAEPYFSLLKKAGFGVVVHIEVTGLTTLVEREDLHVLENEMLYEKITIDYNQPNVEEFLYLAQILDYYRKERVYVHCTTGYCTSALIIPYLMLKNDWTLSEALESVIVWSIPPQWGKSIEAAIESIRTV
jgi:protein-tyrosine phosphatase